MSKTLWRETLQFWMFSFLKLPLVWWIGPRITELTESSMNVLIQFRRRTRNHVGSMYFGVLCVGAELAAGFLTMSLMKNQKGKYSLIIKDFQAQFFKRVEADAYFTCIEGNLIADAIKRAIQTNERQNITLNVIATVPAKFGNEAVGKFVVTISIKKVSE